MIPEEMLDVRLLNERSITKSFLLTHVTALTWMLEKKSLRIKKTMFNFSGPIKY